MVMVVENSGSSSDSEGGRHDRFRSERGFLGGKSCTSSSSRGAGHNHRRSQSRSPSRTKSYGKNRGHHSSRSPERRRHKLGHKSSKDTDRRSKHSYERNSPSERKRNLEQDKRKRSPELKRSSSDLNEDSHKYSKEKNNSKHKLDKDRVSKDEKKQSRVEQKKQSGDEQKKQNSDEHRRQSSGEQKKLSSDEQKKQNNNENKKQNNEEQKEQINDDQKKQSSDEWKKSVDNHSKSGPSTRRSRDNKKENEDFGSFKQSLDDTCRNSKSEISSSKSNERKEVAKSKLDITDTTKRTEHIAGSSTEDDENDSQTKSDDKASQDDGYFGPMLPPTLSKTSDSQEVNTSSDSSSDKRLSEGKYSEEVIGINTFPTASPLKSNNEEIETGSEPHEDEEEEEKTGDTVGIGPELPPVLGMKATAEVVKPIEEPNRIPIGPELPLAKTEESDREADSRSPRAAGKKTMGPLLPTEDEQCYGPALPPGLRPSDDREEGEAEDSSSGDDAESIGPLPPGAASSSAAHQALQHRAATLKRQMQNKGSDSEDSKKLKSREEWMLKLPEKRTCLDVVETRKFRSKAAPSSDPTWTETPQEKLDKCMRGSSEAEAEKGTEEEERRAAGLKQRDEQMEKLVKKAKKRDTDSLLHQHQKALKKKKKKEKKEREKEGKKEERRPFDRNIDLQANRLDEAQRKAVFKKAQLLNSRFSFGESKYL